MFPQKQKPGHDGINASVLVGVSLAYDQLPHGTRAGRSHSRRVIPPSAHLPNHLSQDGHLFGALLRSRAEPALVRKAPGMPGQGPLVGQA